jgi:hypothetical protein
MKKILVPLFSLIVSFNAYGEWTFVAESEPSDSDFRTFYVDFDSVKVNGNIYHWELVDYLKPDQWGDLSAKILWETDCNIPQKYRMLSSLYYIQPMGKGSTSTTSNKLREWNYIVSDSIAEETTNRVCAYANQ